MCEIDFIRFTSGKPKYCDACIHKRKSQIMTERYKDEKYIEIIRNIGFLNKGKKCGKSGEEHHQWKGDNVGKDALHFWVIRHKKDPGFCEHCGTKDKKLEWSNISQQYKRILSDWQRLCRSCHLKYDIKAGVRNGKK